MNIKNKKILILSLIIIVGGFLRLFNLDKIPSSLNWDEVDAGYNAYTIANWGADEWGQTLPLVFTSFRDDKHPVHIYSLVPFVKLFGLSDFITRLPSALVGTLSILIIYYLAFYLFENELVSLISAFLFAISPYSIQFSRGLWESNFALFFFLLGLTLFYKAIRSKSWLINLSFLSFGISLFAYHSSKVVVPIVIVLLFILYFKELKKLSKNFYSALGILIIFIVLLILNPRLSGLERAKQNQFSSSDIEKTQIFKLTHNSLLGWGEITLDGMVKHFDPQYLFIKGDQSPRNSVKVFGEFYTIEALFILVGLIGLLFLRSRVSILLLVWTIIAPIPASLVLGAPNANRAIFMLGSLNLISGFGLSILVNIFKSKWKFLVLTLLLIPLVIQAYGFINYYFTIYPKKDPNDWVYGMREVVNYVKDNNDKYDQIYMTDIRSQPYIYFLYYLKIPLSDFKERAFLNNGDSKTYSLISSFGKYNFGNWDIINSTPQPRVLYIVTPSQYDGLKNKVNFDVKKLIRFPDGADAFYIISSIQ